MDLFGIVHGGSAVHETDSQVLGTLLVPFFTVSGFQRLQGISAGLEHALYDHFAHASTSATAAAAAATMLPKQQ